MKIKFLNCNFSSPTGPNSFGLRLAMELKRTGFEITSSNADVELVFIEKDNHLKPIPLVHRLDGVWMDKNSNYETQNENIKYTYSMADQIIFQSNFDKNLIESFFFKRINTNVIYNGENIEEINNVKPLENKSLDKFETIWATASDWRRRKRLREHIEYFLEFSSTKECLVVAGNNPDYEITHERIFYVGHLPRVNLLSLFKRTKYFLGMFYQDHCPNVIIQARLCGCHVICTTSGGIKEIVGENSTILKEKEEYDFKPCDLQNPPPLEFDKTERLVFYLPEEKLDIKNVANKYIEVFKKCQKS